MPWPLRSLLDPATVYMNKIQERQETKTQLLLMDQGLVKKIIKVPQQIIQSYDRIANERLVYTVIEQW